MREHKDAVDRFGTRRTALLFVTCLTLASTRAPAQARAGTAPADSLFRTVAALDSALFDAYNRCDLEKLGSYVSDDLEFYHDQTGLARGRQALIDGVQRNVCGKVRRDLVPGTLEVHPLKGYGAVETGVHLFCDPRTYRTCANATSGIDPIRHGLAAPGPCLADHPGDQLRPRVVARVPTLRHSWGMNAARVATCSSSCRLSTRRLRCWVGVPVGIPRRPQSNQ